MGRVDASASSNGGTASCTYATSKSGADPYVSTSNDCSKDCERWPPRRFPSWLLASAENGGLDLPSLNGLGAACEVTRLVAESRPFVWRQGSLCPRLEEWGLAKFDSVLGRGQKFDTNVSSRLDRKFVYFSP